MSPDLLTNLWGPVLSICNLTGRSNPFPVVAHALTEVEGTCN